MASGISGRSVRINKYGITVVRNAANLPQTASQNIFQVTGGRVLLTTIVGEVTTTIQTLANATYLQSSTTSGSWLTGMCAPVDISTLTVGVLFGITGTPANAGLVGASVPQTNELVMTPGFIKLVTAASATGQMKWLVTYIPLDDGATVVAV